MWPSGKSVWTPDHEHEKDRRERSDGNTANQKLVDSFLFPQELVALK